MAVPAHLAARYQHNAARGGFEEAAKLDASALIPALKPDSVSGLKTAEALQSDAPETIVTIAPGAIAIPLPAGVQPLASLAARARGPKDALTLETGPGPKSTGLLAQAPASHPQGSGSSPGFGVATPVELNEDASPPSKASSSELVSPPASISNAKSASSGATQVAAPGIPSALSSPNAPAVAGAPIGSSPALVERFVEQIADAREAGRAIRPELTLRHGEFGPVGLRLETGSSTNIGEWRATLMARDPGFIPAVQAALGERISAASESGLSHNGAYSQRGNENGSPSSGSNASGQSGSPSTTANGGGEQRYGSSTGEGQGSAKPYSGEEALGGSNMAAADILETGASDAAEGASGTSGALFA